MGRLSLNGLGIGRVALCVGQRELGSQKVLLVCVDLVHGNGAGVYAGGVKANVYMAVRPEVILRRIKVRIGLKGLRGLFRPWGFEPERSKRKRTGWIAISAREGILRERSVIGDYHGLHPRAVKHGI